jgi:hypothetical protein
MAESTTALVARGKKCPFYGFASPVGTNIFLSSGGNQCAMIRDSHAPCSMEMQEKTPDWDDCPILADREKSVFCKIISDWQVFPPEAKNPHGVSFVSWFMQILGRLP